MCIAILNRVGTLPLKMFKNCWTNNPDGGGFAYFDGSRVSIVKEMKSYKKLHAAYCAARDKFPAADFAIHFRIATHGRVNSTNCHPFRISEVSAFIHNGVINGMNASGDFSDTYLFNESIAKKLPADFINNTAITALLADFIGYSKLVIITGAESAIINEDLGHWDESGGNWYSNESYNERKYTTGGAYSGGYSGGYSGAYSGSYSGAYTGGGYKGGAWDYSGADGFEFDEKSKMYVKKEKAHTCDCCLSDSSAEYVKEWQIYACKDCLTAYSNDLLRD